MLEWVPFLSISVLDFVLLYKHTHQGSWYPTVTTWNTVDAGNFWKPLRRLMLPDIKHLHIFFSCLQWHQSLPGMTVLNQNLTGSLTHAHHTRFYPKENTVCSSNTMFYIWTWNHSKYPWQQYHLPLIFSFPDLWIFVEGCIFPFYHTWILNVTLPPWWSKPTKGHLCHIKPLWYTEGKLSHFTKSFS